jgi:hypothetical protein
MYIYSICIYIYIYIIYIYIYEERERERGREREGGVGERGGGREYYREPRGDGVLVWTSRSGG